MAKPPAPARITYQDSKGESSERVVTFTATSRSGGEIYLDGFCHKTNQRRTFCASRILSMVDLATNLEVGDPVEWAFAYRSRQEEIPAPSEADILSVNIAQSSAPLPQGQTPSSTNKPADPSHTGGWIVAGVLVLSLLMGFALFSISSSQWAPAPPAKAEVIHSDQDKASEILEDVSRMGAIDKHEMGASGMARIWAGPKWEGLTQDQKTSFCAAVLAVHNADGVRVISRSGKTLGSYNRSLGYSAH